MPLTENEIATQIVDCAYHIHTTLGPGLLESVYERVLSYELEKRGLQVERQVTMPIVYGELRFDEGFRADLVINNLIIVELKSQEKVAPVHKKQLLTYLRMSGRKLGLLINFGEPLLKQGVTRLVNGL